MRVKRVQSCDGRSQCRDLRQRKIHENNAALDHMHSKISVDAGQDQAGNEGSQQKTKDVHVRLFHLFE